MRVPSSFGCKPLHIYGTLMRTHGNGPYDYVFRILLHKANKFLNKVRKVRQKVFHLLTSPAQRRYKLLRIRGPNGYNATGAGRLLHGGMHLRNDYR